jgi:hypothetical protein
MSYKYGYDSVVYQNRLTFIANLGIEFNQVSEMSVTFQDKIANVDTGDKKSGFGVKDDSYCLDALLTTKPQVGLFLTIADCIPAIIFDPVNKILALVHLGFLNTDLQVVPKTITKLKKEYKSKLEDLVVILGPGASKNSFYYDSNIFKKINTDWGQFIKEREESKFFIDNLGYNLKQIRDLGIPEKNVYYSTVDTVTDDRFYSHFAAYHKKVPDKRFAICVGMCN